MKFKDLILGIGDRILKDSEDKPELAEAMKMLAAFCGVQITALFGWFEGKAFASGVKLMKLREAFLAAGYEFEEYTYMPESMLNLAFLVAHGKITDNDLKKFNFPNRDEMLRSFTSGRMISKDRIEFVGQLIAKEYAEAMREKEKLREPFLILRNIQTEKVPVILHSAQELKRALTSIEYVIEKASDSIETLLHDKDERESLRKDNELMFKISNKFTQFSDKINALCSEKALERYLENQSKENKNGSK